MESPLLARSSAAMSEYEVAPRKARIACEAMAMLATRLRRDVCECERKVCTLSCVVELVVVPYDRIISRWSFPEVSRCGDPYMALMWLLHY